MLEVTGIALNEADFGDYRYGFNGKENDQEWGKLIQDYGFRLYNPAIAKFLSVDPLAPSYPWYTPYQFAGNMPIGATDLDGLEPQWSQGYNPWGIIANLFKKEKVFGKSLQYWEHHATQKELRHLGTVTIPLTVATQYGTSYMGTNIGTNAVSKMGGNAMLKEVTVFAKKPRWWTRNIGNPTRRLERWFGRGFSKVGRWFKGGWNRVFGGGGKSKLKQCFTAGTLIHAKDSLKVIESIIPGDTVWAYNEKTGKNELKKVVQTFINKVDKLLIIEVQGEKIFTTEEHPFYVNGEWIEAKRLKKGSLFTLFDKSICPIQSISVKDTTAAVYNFEVAELHNYYVTKFKVLVHNNCDLRAKGIAEAIIMKRGGKEIKSSDFVKRIQITVGVLDVIDDAGKVKRLVTVNKSGALTSLDIPVGDQIKGMLKQGEEYINPMLYVPSNPKAHAEEVLIEYAKQNGYKLKGRPIGADKDICPKCEKLIKDEGISNQTPFRSGND